MIDWYVEGVSFGNCSCDYGCPCQFERKPTQGYCRGFEVMEVQEGYFGETRLEGLRIALLYAWPGAIYEGNGAMQTIIDERANPAQREALTKILHGQETEPGATHWWVYHEMSKTVHPPLFKSIECEIDIEAREAHVRVGDILTSSGRPIRSPATGNLHRVRIDIPEGIEFELAEIGSATTKASGAISLDLNDSYGQFNIVRHSGTGVVRSSSKT